MTNKSLEFTTDPAMFHNHFSRNVRTLNTSVNSRLAYFWDFTDTGGERRGEKNPQGISTLHVYWSANQSVAAWVDALLEMQLEQCTSHETEMFSARKC